MLLRSASLQALGVETGAAAGMATALTAFTTHGVIHRVHNYTTVVGTATEPTAAAGLTALFEGMVGVTYDAHSSLAGEEHLAGLA